MVPIKCFLIAVLFLCSGFLSRAQQAQITLGTAYGFGTNGVTYGMFEQSKIVGNDIHMTAKRLTLGSGFNYRGDLRYFFNEYIGIGLQGTLYRGKWQTFTSDRKIVFVQHTIQDVRARGFMFAAAFHARADAATVIPYVSIIPGFFFGTLDLMDTISYSGQVQTSTWEYNDLSSFYVSFATGVDVVLNKELNFFMEAEFQNLTVAPKSARLLIRNGSDELDGISVSDQRMVFLDEIKTDYTQVPDDNLPRKMLKIYFPLDSFQIRLGFRLVLGT
jgi:hypothetical protein